MRAIAFFKAAVLLALLASCSEPPPVVEPGKQVSLLYQASIPGGEVIDANPDEGPLVFVVGTGKLQPKVEEMLIGMRVGEEKTFTIPDAYGAHDPNKTGTLSRDSLPADLVPEVGDLMPMVGAMPVTIKEVHDGHLVLDLNHPLAGKEITFKVEIAEVKDPEPSAADKVPVKKAPGAP